MKKYIFQNFDGKKIEKSAAQARIGKISVNLGQKISIFEFSPK